MYVMVMGDSFLIWVRQLAIWATVRNSGDYSGELMCLSALGQLQGDKWLQVQIHLA